MRTQHKVAAQNPQNLLHTFLLFFFSPPLLSLSLSRDAQFLSVAMKVSVYRILTAVLFAACLQQTCQCLATNVLRSNLYCRSVKNPNNLWNLFNLPAYCYATTSSGTPSTVYHVDSFATENTCFYSFGFKTVDQILTGQHTKNIPATAIRYMFDEFPVIERMASDGSRQYAYCVNLYICLSNVVSFEATDRDCMFYVNPYDNTYVSMLHNGNAILDLADTTSEFRQLLSDYYMPGVCACVCVIREGVFCSCLLACLNVFMHVKKLVCTPCRNFP